MSKFLSTPSARRATRALFARFTKIQRFLSTPSARRATGSGCEQSQKQCYFYPRPPRGGRQPFVTLPCCSFGISIHALREEGDRLVLFYYRPDWKFLSTPSARRATKIRAWKAGDDEFLSTPSARRATDYRLVRLAKFDISIHALREEGDQTDTKLAMTLANFYPRPPRGGRFCAPCKIRFETLFLSTPSARRATSPHCVVEAAGYYFYPRPPRGGRPAAWCSPPMWGLFLSTPSARRATHQRISDGAGAAISIHALREEGDGH